MSLAKPAGPRSPVLRVLDCHVARPGAEGFEFLLMKRAKGQLYAGQWRMVAGKIEAGEAAWQACLREIAEETALPVARLFVVPFINRFYEWRADRISEAPVFLALVAAGSEPQLNDEHTEAIWVAPTDAPRYLHWPDQLEGLRRAAALLTPASPLKPDLEIPLPVHHRS